MRCITFKEALELAGETKSSRPTLLLGNGFSIAYDKEIFSYNALFNSVDWSNAERVKRVFDALKTWDFEIGIRNLETAGNIIDIYGWEADRSAILRHDADFLKDALIRAIQAKHPAHIFEVNQERMQKTFQFLRNFGRLFSVNYDLLLYWALIQSGQSLSRLFTDGFKQSDGGGLEWADFPNQSILYLHGALHLFQNNGKVEKIKYQQTSGGRLIQQISERIINGHAPLFVCEGTNQQKLVHINSSRYLRFCFNQLGHTNGPLFLYGLSLGDSDQHILAAIAGSQVNHLFVSLHGDPNSDHNRNIQGKAHDIQRDRLHRPLKVDFYSSESAEIW